jgi:hypothetical protein
VKKSQSVGFVDLQAVQELTPGGLLVEAFFGRLPFLWPLSLTLFGRCMIEK